MPINSITHLSQGFRWRVQNFECGRDARRQRVELGGDAGARVSNPVRGLAGRRLEQSARWLELRRAAADDFELHRCAASISNPALLQGEAITSSDNPESAGAGRASGNARVNAGKEPPALHQPAIFPWCNWTPIPPAAPARRPQAAIVFVNE